MPRRTTPNSDYFTRSRRDGKKVMREYVGRKDDPVVAIVLRREQIMRAEEAAAVMEVRAEQREFLQIEPSLAQLAVYMAEFESYLRPSIREAIMNESKCQADHPNTMPTREYFDHLVALTKRGDKMAAEQLKRLIETNPSIWRLIGNMANHLEHALIEMIGGEDLVLRQSLELHIGEMKQSLCQDAHGEVLVTMLADNVAICWLESQYARMAAIQPQRHKKDALFWVDRLERANERYLEALEKLAVVRKTLGCASEKVPIEPHLES